jgi:phenylalanyl-tRNA synthetase alpha chain
MSTDLTKLETELLAEIAAAADLTAIEAVRVSALGKKGRVSELMSKLGSLPADERKAFGQSVNTLKAKVTGALEARKDVLETAALDVRLKTERADVTLPVRPGPVAEGRIHPVSQVLDEVIEIFAYMGFKVAEGPDIETDEMNFDKLNIPENHPARQDHDTFYFPPNAKGERLLLRTHTSPVQIRTMVNAKPPIRIIAPAASIAATATRPTRRCSIRSKGSSSTRRHTWDT